MSDTKLSEDSYLVASAMAGKKEKAIERAISHHFENKPWDENDVKNICTITTDQFGTEELIINGKPMLKIGPIRTNTIVSRRNVICTFAQTIELMYK